MPETAQKGECLLDTAPPSELCFKATYLKQVFPSSSLYHPACVEGSKCATERSWHPLLKAHRLPTCLCQELGKPAEEHPAQCSALVQAFRVQHVKQKCFHKRIRSCMFVAGAHTTRQFASRSSGKSQPKNIEASRPTTAHEAPGRCFGNGDVAILTPHVPWREETLQESVKSCPNGSFALAWVLWAILGMGSCFPNLFKAGIFAPFREVMDKCCD